MLGAIVGDIVGSLYEFMPTKKFSFPLFALNGRFTDDTVLTCAIAKGILEEQNFTPLVKDFARKYPNAGYGGNFYYWARSEESKPYNSWGNGSAMRVSPVGFAYNDLEIVLQKAKESAEITHNHPEGIKGAQATAVAILLAREKQTKHQILNYIEDQFHYDVHTPLDDIRPTYKFDVSCQGSVPQAIRAFLESDSFEHAIRLAVSLGGDSDTQACITGGIAQAFYGRVPEIIKETAFEYLDNFLGDITQEFCDKYDCW